MAEQIEEQQSGELSIGKFLDIFKRRHMYFLLSLLVGWVAVWASSWVLPTRYKSNTLILVERPTMPQNYVAPNVNEDLQDRLQSITQQILSRTRLLMIIDKLNLYSGAKSLKTQDDKIEAMRKDITVELVRDTRNNEISAFKVSFSAPEPQVAEKVASELTALFISENLKERQEQSQDTTKFIEKQLDSARQILLEQEAKVRQFQAAHQGALPSQQTSNLQILTGLQGQLQSQQDSLNTANQQRVYYQSLIEQHKTLHASGRTADGGPSEISALDQELTKLKAQLIDLSSRYTDSYPDVQKLKAQIAETEMQRQELLASSAKSGPKRPVDAESAPLLQLQSQLQANQAEISNRERTIAALESRIGEYQTRLNSEPATEQELAELTRGYDQSKANYDELLKKKNQSVMATSMEQMQQGERFTMLDPPSHPTKPDFPNRRKFSAFGIAAGIGLGLLVVFLFEFLDDRLHDEKELKALLGTPIISEVPEIQSPLDEERQKRRSVVGWATAIAVVTSILVGSAFSILRG
jgi:polysaccharide biosynthesis transport protein